MSELLGHLFIKDTERLIQLFKKKLINVNCRYDDYNEFKNGDYNLIYNNNNHFINFENKITLSVYGKIYNLNQIANEYRQSKRNLLIFLYKEIGISKMLCKLNGDFILSIYDSELKKLFLCRDRFGLRPIYYSISNGSFLFSSRSSIISKFIHDSDYDINFIKRFAGYHYRYIDNEPEYSPYKNIFQIPASKFLKLSLNSEKKINIQNLTLESYWKLEENTQENFKENENDLVEKYKELLLDSVKIRLNDVEKPSFTLSGGMDSSTVLANAVKATGNKQPAFSTIYKDKTYDESEEISSMLDKFVSKWHAIEIEKPNLQADLDKMIEANDEPIATATWLSNFIMCREINKLGYSNLFGGLGGDELNAGEYEYFFYYFADLLYSENNFNTFNEEVNFWVKNHDHPIFKKSLKIANEYIAKNIDPNTAGRCKADQERLYRYSNTILEPIFDEKKQPFMKHPYNSYLKNRTYQDIFYETVPCSVRAQLRNANYYNIDNFLPFFDYRLVEFMFKVPNILKIKNGVTKILLRKSMKNILPDETRKRIKKTGWNAPAHLWFSQTSLSFLMDLVNSQKFKERGIYNLNNVNYVINEHLNIIKNNEIKDNHMMFLWQLVNLELWFQKNE